MPAELKLDKYREFIKGEVCAQARRSIFEQILALARNRLDNNRFDTAITSTDECVVKGYDRNAKSYNDTGVPAQAWAAFWGVNCKT